MATILNLSLWRSAPHGDVWLWRGNTEIRPALHYLREVDALQRPVFVHAYYQQLFKLYTHSAALSAPVSFAQSGWPCCVPGRPWHSYAPDHDEVTQEVTTLVARHGSQPFYVLLYARPSWPSRDSAAVYETQFAARHCATSWRFDTNRVALLKVECAASE